MLVLTITGFLALAVIGVALQLLARRRRSTLPGLPAFTAAALRYPIGRWTLLVLWWWVGWHFFVR